MCARQSFVCILCEFKAFKLSTESNLSLFSCAIRGIIKKNSRALSFSQTDSHLVIIINAFLLFFGEENKMQWPKKRKISKQSTAGDDHIINKRDLIN